jgi:hypothetical protein
MAAPDYVPIFFKNRLHLAGRTRPSDFAHLIVARLFHHIGYVRGVLNGDGVDGYIVDAKSNKAKAAARLVRRGAIAVSRRPAVRDGSLVQDQIA